MQCLLPPVKHLALQPEVTDFVGKCLQQGFYLPLILDSFTAWSVRYESSFIYIDIQSCKQWHLRNGDRSHSPIAAGGQLDLAGVWVDNQICLQENKSAPIG